MKSISQIFKGAAKAFRTFPAAIACAVGFALVTMVRIQLDWPQQEPYNFLFNCLHWAFALGALFSLAAITAAQSRINSKRAFGAANLLGVLAAGLTFLTLYWFGGDDSTRYAVITALSRVRVGVVMLISTLAFITFAGYPKERSDFSRSFFMFHKAFFIALLYGLALMAGISGVAGAVQALLYNAMSSKVYMYIGTLSGFAAFTIFVGYFPDFRKGTADGRREIAQTQPRFIEVLLGYIVIPIMLALTVVLLIWAGKTIIGGMEASFTMLYRIAATYALGGIWLHVMVTHYKSGLAKFYRSVYPIAALAILAFEAWALFIRLGQSGLKTTEYYFALLWVLAVASAVLLLFLRARAQLPIVILVCALGIFSVLPAVGYHVLPVTAQVNRLEKLLTSQGMLADDEIIPASSEPERDVRESITDAVDFLAYSSDDAKLPAWMDRDLGQSDVFKDRLGFEKSWSETNPDYPNGSDTYLSTSLYLPDGAVAIDGYGWVVYPQNSYKDTGGQSTVTGDNGTYTIAWTTDAATGIPNLKISLDGRVILEQDMNDYIDMIAEKYPPGQNQSNTAALDDMCLKFETPEANVLLVFSNIEISLNAREDDISYWLNLNALYLGEE